MRPTLRYGVDSPGIVIGEAIASAIAFGLAFIFRARRSANVFGLPLWIVLLVVASYFLLAAAGMVQYSTMGKLALRDRLLRQIAWRGDEQVLDVGCGRGLLLVGAAKHLTTGRAIGLDAWNRGAITGNTPEAALDNARREGVAERVEVRAGDARRLPFDDGAFDVVVSNFVVHEMDSGADRDQLLREMARVLRPGGRVAVIDFIFTGQAVRVFRDADVADARRSPAGVVAFAAMALLTLGAGQLYLVVGRKTGA